MPICIECRSFERASLQLWLYLPLQCTLTFDPCAPGMAGSPRDRSRSRSAPHREPGGVRPNLSHQLSMAVADVLQYSGHLLSYPPEDPRPPLGYIVRVENMEAQHIHHPNVADNPAELRAVEAALDVHITPVIPATSGEPAAPGSSRLTSPEHDDLESFGRGPPPPLPVNRPPSGEPPASAPARGDVLTPHPVLAALAKAGALG